MLSSFLGIGFSFDKQLNYQWIFLNQSGWVLSLLWSCLSLSSLVLQYKSYSREHLVINFTILGAYLNTQCVPHGISTLTRWKYTKESKHHFTFHFNSRHFTSIPGAQPLISVRLCKLIQVSAKDPKGTSTETLSIFFLVPCPTNSPPQSWSQISACLA